MFAGLDKNLRVPWGWSEVIKLALGYLVILPAVILLTPVILRVTAPELAHYLGGFLQSELEKNFAYVIAEAVGILGIIWLLLRKYDVKIWRALGWRRVGVARTVGYVLGAMVVFYIVSVAINNVADFLNLYDTAQTQENEFTGTGMSSPLAVLALVLLPPIIEETMFRGFIFPALAGKMGFWWAAVLSSILFGLAHGQVNVAVYTLALGMILCWMRAKTNSIVPGVLLHGLNNTLAYLVMVGR